MAETTVLRRFLRNILSNMAGYFVTVVVALFLSPFVVHSLGDEIYGLWTLVVSLTGYYGLLDLGVRSAVGQYVSRYWAQGDMDGVNRTVNTAIVLMCGVALVAVVATILLAVFLPDWIDAEGDELAAAQWALVITGLGVAVGFPLAIYATIAYARERFDIDNAIGIPSRLLTAGLTVWMLKAGHGILSLAVVTTGLNTLSALIRIYVAHRLMPRLRFAPRLFRRDSVKEICGYGIFSFMVNAADRIVVYTDVIVIGAFLSTTAITYYAIGANLVPYYIALVNAVAWTISPYAVSCDARGDTGALRRLLIGGTRGLFFMSAVVGAGLLLLGEEFISLWMGPRYVSGDQYASSAVVLAILVWSGLVRGMQSCALQILFGMRKVRFLAGLSFLEASLNLGLSLMLVSRMGVIGVALGTLIPAILLPGGVHAVYVVRRLKMSWVPYALSIARAGVPVMAAMAIMDYWAGHMLDVTSWTSFVVKAFVVALPVPLVGFFFVMTPEERRKLLRRFRLGRQDAES